MTGHLIIAALPLLVLLLVTILLLCRKRLRLGLRARAADRRLRIVETLGIDPKRRLLLVDADGCRITLLVGGGTDIVLNKTAMGTGRSSSFGDWVGEAAS